MLFRSISRLIDRPIRPLFPEGFYNEVQVVVHVVSINPDVPADIPALIGASAALAVSGIPFNGYIQRQRQDWPYHLLRQQRNHSVLISKPLQVKYEFVESLQLFQTA